MRHKKCLLVFLTIAFLCVILVPSFANATETETIEVARGDIGLMTVNLAEGDRFSCTLSIEGGESGNSINFSVTDPQGDSVADFGRVLRRGTFDFTAQKNGAYTLHLSNNYTVLGSKWVTVSYDVERETVANPVVMPILIVLTAVVLVGIGVWVFLRHKKRRHS